MSKLKSINRGIFDLDGGQHARTRHLHSVFEDASCSVASHHRCANVIPACSCDSVLETESSRHECACAHGHVHPARSGVRETTTMIEAVPQGVL
jgi:hypothetical protein